MSKTHRSSKRLRHPVSSQVATASCLALCLALVAQSAHGDITYHLNFNPANSGEEQQVANSVAVAAAFYNQHGSFNKHWSVSYNPGIPTAQANINGDMGFGGSRNERVVFHEAAHTFGMGTHWAYGGLLAGGVWQGKYGNQAQFDTYNAYGDGLHGDGHAIWPGGFNFDNEDGYLNRIWHVRVMAGMRADLGYLSFTREALNEAVVSGETAEFRVESPMASSWQWQKDGVNLSNGGDFSGVNTATLRIANAEAADAGSYRCVATGAGETLNSRPRQLWVHPASKIGHLAFDGNSNDSAGTNHGTHSGVPLYVPGKIGQAVDLNGINDFIDLPDPVGRTRETTISAWVNWDGGGDWQRVFDFGSGTLQYLFLTPKAGGGGVRLALFDPINGKNVEYQANGPTLSTGQWVHLAAVLRENYMTLYVNGQAVGTGFIPGGGPAIFPATNNYIGKSQFADPYFNGRVDDFQVHARAFSGPEVWSLWGQSANQAPTFLSGTMTFSNARSLEAYTGQTLAGSATDADGNALTYSKFGGPAWLNVASNGALSGTPPATDSGLQTFYVRVTDSAGASSDAEVRITVTPLPTIDVTSTTTTPVPDSDDASYLASGIEEASTINGSGTASATNDESTYVAPDRSSKGQTFTTGSNPNGYTLGAFSFQHVAWPTYVPNGTAFDVQWGDTFEIQIGKMTGTTKTPIQTAFARYTGDGMGGGGNGTGRFLRFPLAALSLPTLQPNTTYYFEIAPENGGPYFELNSASAATYAGGTAFRGNVGADLGKIGTGVTALPGDFVFVAELGEPFLPLSTSLTAPPAGSDDRYFLPVSGISEANTIGGSGTASGTNDESTYVSSDRSSKGQTFTTGTNASGYTLGAVTVQHVKWPTYVDNGTFYDVQPGDTFAFQFGSMAGTTKTPIRTSVARYLGDPIVRGSTSGTGLFLTIDLSNAGWPVLAPNTKYYFELAPKDGAPFLELNSASAAGYVGGNAYRGNTGADLGKIGGAVNNLAGDFVFHTKLTAVAPTYATWIGQYPGVGGQGGIDDDPDGDGVANGIEIHFGTNPTVPSAGLTQIAKSGSSLTFRHPQTATPASDVSVGYRWSRDLQTWHASGVSDGGTTVTFSASANTPQAGTTTVTATITGSNPDRLFVELQVTGP